MGQYSISIDVEYNGAVQYQYRCRVKKGTGVKEEILFDLHPLNKNELHQQINVQKIAFA
jgi:hypothetical protein